MGLQLKRRIITLLLDIMDSTIADHDLMRNGCLAICQFKIPEDVVSFILLNILYTPAPVPIPVCYWFINFVFIVWLFFQYLSYRNTPKNYIQYVDRL